MASARRAAILADLRARYAGASTDAERDLIERECAEFIAAENARIAARPACTCGAALERVRNLDGRLVWRHQSAYGPERAGCRRA